MRALGKINPGCESIFAGDGHRESEEIPIGIQRHIKIQRFKKCGLGGGKDHLAGCIGPGERSVDDRQRRLCLHRSERVERT
jgi:hypothetical protein